MPRFLKVAHQRKSDGSLFTEADLAAQDALSSRAARNLPRPAGRRGDERGAAGRTLACGRQRACGAWTPSTALRNFVYGLPFFAVSVALMRHGRSELGVVYDPVADEVFYAERGARRLSQRRAAADPRLHAPHLHSAMANVDFKRLGAG